METALTIVIILLVLMTVFCVLMLRSIRQYNSVLLEQRSMIKKLTRQCQEAEQKAMADTYRAASEKNRDGRADAVELRNLRRQNATLVRQVEEAEKIKQAFLVLKERCRRLEEAQGISADDSVQKDIMNTQVLASELNRIKHAYVQHLKEHGKMLESLDEAKAENISLTSQLLSYEQKNAMLNDLLQKAGKSLPEEEKTQQMP